jgi:hypothetical protein
VQQNSGGTLKLHALIIGAGGGKPKSLSVLCVNAWFFCSQQSQPLSLVVSKKAAKRAKKPASGQGMRAF